MYRHFASSDDLLVAVGLRSVGSFLDRLAAHVAGIRTPAEALVEAMASSVERIPRDELIASLLVSGRADAVVRGVTSDEGRAFARSMLARMDVDWPAHGFAEADLDGLAEFSLLVVQSLLLGPRQKRTRAQLRAFLTRWIAPALETAPGTTFKP